MLYAWNLVLQRQQSLVAEPIEVATFQAAMMGLALALFAPFLFVLPGRESWPEIAGSAALSVGATLLLTWAYARAEAQALVPLEYSGFLWAALFGWLLFGEGLSLAGAARRGADRDRLLDRRAEEAARADRGLTLVRGRVRRRLAVAPEAGRVPHQPERSAEERREHQRECHGDHVKRLFPPAGGA